MAAIKPADLQAETSGAIARTEITDIHTHLFTPQFGSLLLWGIDDLLTYHYLVAETFRWINLPYQEFWQMPKQAQANLIWRTLFVEHSPVSEACRGVLTVLDALGLDVSKRDLNSYRGYFAECTTDAYLDRVLKISGVSHMVMTNDPFVPEEYAVWKQGYTEDPRFSTALRMDTLLNNWPGGCRALRDWGYNVDVDASAVTKAEVRRFLSDWIGRMRPLYLAVSLPPTFNWPEESPRSWLLADCVLPVAADHGLPLAMMIGVKKLVNPELRLAGDSEAKAAIEPVENLCAAYPGNKFLLTMLARENQHEACVAARKFRNLFPFGCWWFMNNPLLINELTRMRLELLGLSHVPQHSDARVLDQLIYKWAHFRPILAGILTDKYADLLRTGWVVTREEIERDVRGLLGENFWAFLRR